MKLARNLNWITFSAFFLVQLLPNLLFRPFIFHEVGQLSPDVFQLQGSSRHPVSGLSFLIQHPLLFSYDFPVMCLALVFGFLPFAQPSLRHLLFTRPALAGFGIIAGYLVEASTYHLRVLHGHWPADWADGFAFHRHFCFRTLGSVFVAYGFGLCVLFLVQRRRTMRCSELLRTSR